VVSEFLSHFPSAIVDCLNECLSKKNLSAEDTEPGREDRFEGRCILLAEDVAINREIVLALLEPTSLVIDCAENGLEAVEMFSSAPDRYDMIFMDVQMPEMDGYEATRRIRKLDAAKAKEIPIVAMTANVFREDIEKCLDAGMNSHVGKPLDLDDVLATLRAYLA
jgi:CheY-like chemotaxis protein